MVSGHLKENLYCEKCTLTIFYDYPFHLEAKEDAETLKNILFVAIALARRVFPVPGGPNNKIPFMAFRIPLKNSGIILGSNTAY
jgi:hypothetical protein